MKKIAWQGFPTDGTGHRLPQVFVGRQVRTPHAE
jgi:hypothetical protein